MQRDFIDPRGLSEEAYADYRRILMYTDSEGRKGAEKLFEKYGIQMLVFEGFDYLSGQVYPLAVELAIRSRPDGSWSTPIRRASFSCAIRRPGSPR